MSRAAQWRRKLAGTTPTRQDITATGSAGAGSLLTLDQLVARLIPASTRRHSTQAELTRKLLGLPDDRGELPPVRWPTLAEVATASGLTGGRIAQVMGQRRREWSRDDAVLAARQELVAALEGLNRIAAAGELVDQLLMARGVAREEEPERRRAYGYGVLRAVVEADSVADEPRFATRRHGERIVIALQVGSEESLETPGDGQLLDLAVGLADEADRLATRDPLPTPTAVVRALEAVAYRVGLIFGERRLVRALRLAQAGAGIPGDGVTPEWLDARVRARFPGLAPLPAGQELAWLLHEAGIDLRWDGSRFLPPEPHTTGYSSLRRSSTSLGPAAGPGGAVADVASRLAEVAEHGGVRVVTVRRSKWQGCRDRLEETLGVPVRDVSAEFVTALRAVAAERRIPDFDVVLRADAAEPGSRAQTNLQQVVAAAFKQLEQQSSVPGLLVLDALTPLGRYAGGPALVERLADRARRAGRDGGPSALVLLCPAEDERQPPRVGPHAVGLVTPEEWIVATVAWLSDEAGAA